MEVDDLAHGVEVAHAEGGYEARSSIFGPTVADDLVRKAVEMLESGR